MNADIAGMDMAPDDHRPDTASAMKAVEGAYPGKAAVSLLDKIHDPPQVSFETHGAIGELNHTDQANIGPSGADKRTLGHDETVDAHRPETSTEVDRVTADVKSEDMHHPEENAEGLGSTSQAQDHMNIDPLLENVYDGHLDARVDQEASDSNRGYIKHHDGVELHEGTGSLLDEEGVEAVQYEGELVEDGEEEEDELEEEEDEEGGGAEELVILTDEDEEEEEEGSMISEENASGSHGTGMLGTTGASQYPPAPLYTHEGVIYMPGDDDDGDDESEVEGGIETRWPDSEGVGSEEEESEQEESEEDQLNSDLIDEGGRSDVGHSDLDEIEIQGKTMEANDTAPILPVQSADQPGGIIEGLKKNHKLDEGLAAQVHEDAKVNLVASNLDPSGGGSLEHLASQALLQLEARPIMALRDEAVDLVNKQLVQDLRNGETQDRDLSNTAQALSMYTAEDLLPLTSHPQQMSGYATNEPIEYASQPSNSDMQIEVKTHVQTYPVIDSGNLQDNDLGEESLEDGHFADESNLSDDDDSDGENKSGVSSIGEASAESIAGSENRRVKLGQSETTPIKQTEENITAKDDSDQAGEDLYTVETLDMQTDGNLVSISTDQLDGGASAVTSIEVTELLTVIPPIIEEDDVDAFPGSASESDTNGLSINEVNEDDIISMSTDHLYVKILETQDTTFFDRSLPSFQKQAPTSQPLGLGLNQNLERRTHVRFQSEDRDTLEVQAIADFDFVTPAREDASVYVEDQHEESDQLFASDVLAKNNDKVRPLFQDHSGTATRLQEWLDQSVDSEIPGQEEARKHAKLGHSQEPNLQRVHIHYDSDSDQAMTKAVTGVKAAQEDPTTYLENVSVASSAIDESDHSDSSPSLTNTDALTSHMSSSNHKSTNEGGKSLVPGRLQRPTLNSPPASPSIVDQFPVRSESVYSVDGPMTQTSLQDRTRQDTGYSSEVASQVMPTSENDSSTSRGQSPEMDVEIVLSQDSDTTDAKGGASTVALPSTPPSKCGTAGSHAQSPGSRSRAGSTPRNRSDLRRSQHCSHQHYQLGKQITLPENNPVDQTSFAKYEATEMEEDSSVRVTRSHCKPFRVFLPLKSFCTEEEFRQITDDHYLDTRSWHQTGLRMIMPSCVLTSATSEEMEPVKAGLVSLGTASDEENRQALRDMTLLGTRGIHEMHCILGKKFFDDGNWGILPSDQIACIRDFVAQTDIDDFDSPEATKRLKPRGHLEQMPTLNETGNLSTSGSSKRKRTDSENGSPSDHEVARSSWFGALPIVGRFFGHNAVR